VTARLTPLPDIVPPVQFAGNRTFANTSTLSFGGGISITTGATVTNNGAVHVDNANGITGTGSFVQGVFATVTNGGPFLPAGTLNATASPNSIDYNGAAQTVKAVIYSNLTLSGSGAKDLTGVSTINDAFTLAGTASAAVATNLGIGTDVTLGSGTSFTLGSFTITVGGNWTNNGGTVSQGSSTVVFISSGSQSIQRSTQGFANVQFSGVGTKQMIAAAGLFATGNVTIDPGATFDGNTASVHQVSGNWTNNGTFTGGTSTVIFQGGSPSIINGSFGNLQINKTASVVSRLTSAISSDWKSCIRGT